MKHGILLLCVVSLVLAACAGSMTVRTELVRNGHRIVSGDEDIIVKGEVRKFRVSIEAVPLYWDVAGEVGIALQIDRPRGRFPVPAGHLQRPERGAHLCHPRGENRLGRAREIPGGCDEGHERGPGPHRCPQTGAGGPGC